MNSVGIVADPVPLHNDMHSYLRGDHRVLGRRSIQLTVAARPQYSGCMLPCSRNAFPPTPLDMLDVAAPLDWSAVFVSTFGFIADLMLLHNNMHLYAHGGHRKRPVTCTDHCAQISSCIEVSPVKLLNAWPGSVADANGSQDCCGRLGPLA